MSTPDITNRPSLTESLPESEAAEVEQLLSELIKINSINPWISPEGPGEGEVAAFIAGWLGELDGVEVTVDEVEPGRPNVLARVPGTSNGPHLCLNVHTDTVDCAGWRDTAFVPRRVGERLLGLGASDNKAQCAALMLVVKRLAADPAPGPVTAIFAIDEEGPSKGSRHLVKSFTADGCIALEPVGVGRVVVAHQGFGSLDLVVKAAAAHGASDDAPDAGVQLASLITGLARIDREILATSPHPLAGKAFFHTSFIKGGTDWGTYPAELTLGFEMGTNPGETLQDRLNEIQAMIAEVRETEHPGLSAEVVVQLENEPFTATGHERLLAAYAAATEEVLGKQVETMGLNTWTDAAVTQSAGIPTILCGATGGGMHAIDEWAELPSIAQCVAVLEAAARRFGSGAE